MSITGLPGQGPVRVGIPIADLTAGLLLAQAMILALYEREKSGKGQWVHTSLIEAQIFMLDFQASRWLIAGEVPKQAGNDHPTGIPTGVFPTSDGTSTSPRPATICACAAAKRWACRSWSSIRLCDRRRALEEPQGAERAARRVTKTNTSAHWIAALNKAGVPCGPINNIQQTFEEPQVKHLKIARPVRHRKLGEISVVGQPINLSRYPSPRNSVRRPISASTTTRSSPGSATSKLRSPASSRGR